MEGGKDEMHKGVGEERGLKGAIYQPTKQRGAKSFPRKIRTRSFEGQDVRIGWKSVRRVGTKKEVIPE